MAPTLMDHFLNTPGYSTKLIQKFPCLCAYNSIKPKYIAQIDPTKIYPLKGVWISKPKVPGFLKCTELFQDVDGTMRTLPDHVVDQISEAICSINIYPSLIKMCARGDIYQLYLKYTNVGVPDEQPPTTVELEYHFHKSLTKFSGYFGRKQVDDHRLPKYAKVAMDPSSGGSYLRVIYGEGAKSTSTLHVKVNVNGDKNFTTGSKSFTTGNFHSRRMNYLFAPSTTLLDAVMRRIFPSTAHIVKFLVYQMVHSAEYQFRINMALTGLDWSPHRTNEPHYVGYVLHCFATNKATILPTSGDLTPRDYVDAMNTLAKAYPFLYVEEGSWMRPRDCVIDVWERYIGTQLTPQVAASMELSKEAEANLLERYSSDPAKEARIFRLFPWVIAPKMTEDVLQRLKLLRRVKYARDAEFTPHEVFYFNHLPSTLPVESRGFLTGGTMKKPLYDFGWNIYHRMKYTPGGNDIAAVNHFELKFAKCPLTVFEMMAKISVHGGHEPLLDPHFLEAKYSSYSFSPNYRTTPTKDDCLAVRFANVYKDSGYKVPEIPADFMDRLMESEDGPQEESNKGSTSLEANHFCVICLKNGKDHAIPGCGHVTVCELCSFRILKCPLCYVRGNPRKIYF